MASVDGNYEEEWEAEEPSIGKKSVISTIGGQVYPLEGDEKNLTRDAEPTKDEELVPAVISTDQFKASAGNCREGELKAKVDEIVDTDVCNTSDELPTSDDTFSNVGDEKIIITQQPILDTEVSPPDSSDVVKVQHLRELVQIHGQHHGGQSPPPPIPVMASVVSKDAREAESTSKYDVGALQARVAAQRIAEFRRRQTLKAEEERALESAWLQKRREVRRSNDAMYKILGVAGLSAQDHLRIAKQRHKQKAKQTEVFASQERQNRWYNNIPKRQSCAPEHIQELNMEFSRAKREQQRTMQLSQNVVRKNQLQLKQKARAIVTNANGAYVRGSFLLKVTHHTMKTQNESPSKERKEVETE